MKRILAVLMVATMLLTGLPAFGANGRVKLAKVFFHTKSIGNDYSVVARPTPEDYPEYADGTKDKDLIEQVLWDYYYTQTGTDEITGIAYYGADGNLGPVIPLNQTEWNKYAGYIPFSVKKNAAAGSNVTGDLDDTMYIVERDANGNIISKTPIQPGPPVDEPAAWAADAVTALKGWGKLDESFFKNYQGKITRKDFACISVVLYEALKGSNSPTVTDEQKKAFTDTQDDYVLKAHALGLVNGYGNGKYGPADLITREQIARLLVGACETGGMSLTPSGVVTFKDQNQISDWALTYVKSAYKNEIMKGTGELQISPKDNTSREQALQLLYNTLKKAGKLK